MTNGFRPVAVDMARCRAQVYEPVSRNFGQCARKKAVEVDGVGYCNQHSPSAQKRRNEARLEREAAEQRQRDRRFKRPIDYRDALREIAAGHNDPRSVARDALERWGDLDA